MRFLDIVCLQMPFRDGSVSSGAVPTAVYTGVFLSFRRRCFLAFAFYHVGSSDFRIHRTHRVADDKVADLSLDLPKITMADPTLIY